jgi:hypothetical protein
MNNSRTVGRIFTDTDTVEFYEKLPENSISSSIRHVSGSKRKMFLKKLRIKMKHNTLFVTLTVSEIITENGYYENISELETTNTQQ